MGDKKIAPATENGAPPAGNDNAAVKKVLAMKEEVNEAYKNGDSEGAIAAYTKGNQHIHCEFLLTA